jgi:uncharacterized membrane protein
MREYKTKLAKEDHMSELIITVGLGILVCVLSIINMTGNISTLHWYHRRRVSEENRLPFGRLVGTGTLIIGIALIIFGVMFYVSQKTQLTFLVTIGSALLITAVVTGLGISFYAMIKYNKGIF